MMMPITFRSQGDNSKNKSLGENLSSQWQNKEIYHFSFAKTGLKKICEVLIT